jgi:hypothetical protein
MPLIGRVTELEPWLFRALLTVHRGSACLLAGRGESALGQEALALSRDHGEREHEGLGP